MSTDELAPEVAIAYEIAKDEELAMSEYIRFLIREDAKKRGVWEIAKTESRRLREVKSNN